MRVLTAGALFFAVVFSAGFVLGAVRTLWIVPRLGTRTAELFEAPIMLAVSIVAARWVVRRLAVPFTNASRLGVGAIALALLLVAEFSLVLALRHMTIQQYFATRDPVAATVYYVLLIIFALLPRLVTKS